MTLQPPLRQKSLIKLVGSDTNVKLGFIKHHVMIVKLVNPWKNEYRAYCAGSIIAVDRVLTSSNCFLTNRKRYKDDLNKVRVVAGILRTLSKVPGKEYEGPQQWKEIDKVYSQKYYRFPAYDLAILQMKTPFILNQFVDKIPYATLNQDFDGVCQATTVKATTSWSKNKHLFIDNLWLIKQKSCERQLLRSCRLYYCTSFAEAYAETAGGGLICHRTGDPAEVDEAEGILVGVATLINVNLPSLHTRVGLFSKWVTDSGPVAFYDKLLLLFVCCLIKVF